MLAHRHPPPEGRQEPSDHQNRSPNLTRLHQLVCSLGNTWSNWSNSTTTTNPWTNYMMPASRSSVIVKNSSCRKPWRVWKRNWMTCVTVTPRTLLPYRPSNDKKRCRSRNPWIQKRQVCVNAGTWKKLSYVGTSKCDTANYMALYLLYHSQAPRRIPPPLFRNPRPSNPRVLRIQFFPTRIACRSD